MGNNRFKTVAPIYYRRAVGAFLVYDVSNMESFDALECWYSQIIDNTDENIVCMVLGNKSDLSDSAR